MNNELFFTFLSTRPEFKKAKTCRKELVGPMRAYLARYGNPAILEEIENPPRRAVRLVAEREEARCALADFCARCGGCAWGKPAP